MNTTAPSSITVDALASYIGHRLDSYDDPSSAAIFVRDLANDATGRTMVEPLVLFPAISRALSTRHHWLNLGPPLFLSRRLLRQREGG